jgi:hypothetical protein
VFLLIMPICAKSNIALGKHVLFQQDYDASPSLLARTFFHSLGAMSKGQLRNLTSYPSIEYARNRNPDPSQLNLVFRFLLLTRPPGLTRNNHVLQPCLAKKQLTIVHNTRLSTNAVGYSNQRPSQEEITWQDEREGRLRGQPGKG